VDGDRCQSIEIYWQPMTFPASGGMQIRRIMEHHRIVRISLFTYILHALD
jgi:hypothetical protein